MNADEIAREILTSELSNIELHNLFDIVRRKQKMVKDTEVAIKSMSLKIGQRVRLFGLSPKYLNGLEGEVKYIKNTKAKVQLDSKLERFGETPFVPIACLELI